jgi:hypothetical protein
MYLRHFGDDFHFHDFLKKTVSRLIQFLSEKVSVDLAEFERQAGEKLWDLAKKVRNLVWETAGKVAQ